MCPKASHLLKSKNVLSLFLANREYSLTFYDLVSYLGWKLNYAIILCYFQNSAEFIIFSRIFFHFMRFYFMYLVETDVNTF